MKPPWVRRLVYPTLLGLAVFATAFFCMEVSRLSGQLACLWLSNGLVLIVLLGSRRTPWAGWLTAGVVGTMAANLSQGFTASVALALTLCNAVEIVLAGWWGRTLVGPRGRPDLRRVQDLVRFIALCGVTAPALSAMLAAAYFTRIPGAAWEGIFWTWFLSHALGVLLVVPLASVASLKDILQLLKGRQGGEVSSLLGVVALATFAVFWHHRVNWLFILIPLIVAGAYRHGLVGALLTTMAATLAGLGAITLGLHHADAETTPHLQLLQFFALANLLTAVPTAAAFDALKASEKRFRGIFEQGSVAMWILRMEDGAIVDANPAAVEFYGYTKDELLRMKVWDINTLGRQAVEDGFWRCRQQGGGAFVFPHRLADGRVREVQVLSTPFDRDGEQRVLGILYDVTERLQAERRVAEARNYIATLLDASPVGVFTFKASGQAVSANPAAARVVGTSAETLLQQNFRELESWQRGGLLAAAEQALATGEEQSLEAHTTSTYGKEIWLSCRLMPFEHEGEKHLLVVAEDIYRRKRAEEDLRAREEHLRTLLNAAPLAVWFEVEGRVQWSNPRHRVMFGDESSGLQARDFFAHPEVHQALAREGREALEKGEVFTREVELRRSVGSLFWGRLSGKLINVLHPEAGTIWLVEDVTEQRKATEQLRAYAEAQTALLREVNHRVKNNLSEMMGIVMMEEDVARAKGEPQTLRALHDMQERLSSLAAVHSLLTAGAWRPLALRELCEQILGRTALSQGGLQIQEDGPPVMVGPEQAHNLAMVLCELATNTIKYGVLPEAGPRVEVAIGQDERISLTYRDRGPGFPEAVLAKGVVGGSVGMELMRGMVCQTLRGSLQLSNQEGAVVRIEFPAGRQG